MGRLRLHISEAEATKGTFAFNWTGRSHSLTKGKNFFCTCSALEDMNSLTNT
jgi:hypothetical protein